MDQRALSCNSQGDLGAFRTALRKTRKIPSEDMKPFTQAMQNRHLANYQFSRVLVKEDAEETIESAQSFVKRCFNYLHAEGHL